MLNWRALALVWKSVWGVGSCCFESALFMVFARRRRNADSRVAGGHRLLISRGPAR